MKITNQQEILENGYTYIERTYDTGTVEKIMKVEPMIGPIDPINPEPTIAEMINATYLETQYQTVLMEMQSGI
ncbi:hypothetical protein [Acetobacterium sp.]|uniref:hypothetical protein n=1 Tax=Acetobacterium sp. TaxID=1872094 RepID=UPI00271C81FB|nr:hypothetical protein [Acetobacterium sp.]MDO9491417.1 hypothetical protein [Acetobacterium sp.]